MTKLIKILIIFVFILTTGFVVHLAFKNSESIYAQEKHVNMKIKMSFENKEVIIKMFDNSASKQVIELLPAEFKFSDFAGEEKITNFSKPLTLDNAPRGMIATAGKLFIYAPWGNMGIFYKDHGHTIDKSLIPLGEVESGLEHLKTQNYNFKAKLEIIK